ncbi:MAG: TadE family protein [Acidimicrobiales bacterium]
MIAIPTFDGGQSTAELAVLLPALMILTLLVVQVGLVARDQVVVHHAVGEAARRAATDPSEATATAGAEDAAPALDPSRLTVGLSGSRGSGDLLTVSVEYRSATGVPLVGALIGDIDLSTTAVVRIE